MKKLLKFLGIFIVLILAALIVTPMIFKDDIVALVKEEANNNLNAKVDFGDFSLSLIKSFPNFYFSIENIKVEGIDRFEGVELASVGELDLVVDLMSVINGESIAIKKIAIVQPAIHAKVLSDGAANWDIAKESGDEEAEEEETTDEEGGDFKLQLQDITISDGVIIYDDATFPMHMAINDLDLHLTGDMTADKTTLNTTATVAAFDLSYDGIKYMNAAIVDITAGIAADLANSKYTFADNKVQVNELPLKMDGWVAMPTDDIDMDLSFAALETDFKDILSMVPAAFTKDLEGVETSGTLALDGFAKGIYNESTYPAFGVDLAVNNASFHYPDLPKSVEDIQIKTSIQSPSSDLDDMTVDVSRFHLKLAENPFDFTLFLSNPMSDPFIRSGLKGKIVLDNLKDVIPLPEGDELNGTIESDLAAEGRMSTLENEDYESFKAAGNLIVTDMHYASDSLDYPVDIKEANMSFNPQFVELKQLDMLLGKSDIKAQGQLENFIPYALTDGQVLKGSLNMQSDLMDLNELAGIDPEAETVEETDSVEEGAEEPLEVFPVPADIDFSMSTAMKKVIYDNIAIEDIQGGMKIKDAKLSLEKTTMKMLGGTMSMNGFYETSDTTKPTFDFGLGILDFDAQTTIKSFSSIDSIVPIAKHAFGKYSTNFSISGALDQAMEPIYETFFGSGDMLTKNMEVKDFKPMEKVGDALKNDKLKSFAVNDTRIAFKVAEGKLFVEPFDLQLGNSKVTIAGSNSIDQSIDYVFSFAIPREEFGGAANSAVDGLLSQASASGVDIKVADVINVDVRMTGTVTEPKLKTDFKKAKSDATQQLKDQAKEELEKRKAELEQQAKDELEKKKREAEQKAKDEAERLKKEAEEKAKKEVEEQKKKLEEEAKKKLKGLFGK